MIAKNSLSFMLCVERIQTRDCRQERSRDQISLISTLACSGPGLATAGCGNTAADSGRMKTFCSHNSTCSYTGILTRTTSRQHKKITTYFATRVFERPHSQYIKMLLLDIVQWTQKDNTALSSPPLSPAGLLKLKVCVK